MSKLRARHMAVNLNDLFATATRQQFEVEGLVYPELRNNPLKDPVDLDQVSAKIKALESLVDNIERNISTERQAQQRDIWKK